MFARHASLRLHALSLSLLAGVGLSADAVAAPHNPLNLPPVQIAQIGDLCASTIGVKPGFTLYDACVESLSSSAARLDRAATRQAAHRECLDRGAGAGATLAKCELDAADRAGPVAAPAGAAAPAAGKSFYRASAREIRVREQQACAGLGYGPTSGGFASCVASLDAALFAADHPQP